MAEGLQPIALAEIALAGDDVNSGPGVPGAITSAPTESFVEGVTLIAPIVTGDPDDDDEPANHIYTYQWYKDGALISGATDETYLVPVTGAGTYRVAITYTDGHGFPNTVTTDRHISVSNNGNGTPQFITSSIPGIFRGGVTLNAPNVTGDPDGDAENPDYNYQWYKDGAAITGATDKSYKVPITAAGTYKVAITYTDAQKFRLTLSSPDCDVISGEKLHTLSDPPGRAAGSDDIIDRFSFQTSAAPITPWRIAAFNPLEDFLQIPQAFSICTIQKTLYSTQKTSTPNGPLDKRAQKAFNKQQRMAIKSAKRIGKTGDGLAYNQLTGELFIDTNGKKKGFGEAGGLLAVLEGAPEIGIRNFEFL